MSAKKKCVVFTEPSLAALAARLATRGDGARLEVYTKKDGTMTLRVVRGAAVASAAAVTNEPDINESLLCPGPFCPWY